MVVHQTSGTEYLTAAAGIVSIVQYRIQAVPALGFHILCTSDAMRTNVMHSIQHLSSLSSDLSTHHSVFFPRTGKKLILYLLRYGHGGTQATTNAAKPKANISKPRTTDWEKYEAMKEMA